MNNDIETQIHNLEDRLRQAMLNSDVGVLDELLAPELMFTNHLGQRVDKEADLCAHESGALSISRLSTSEQQVRLIGDDGAVVSVRVQLSGTYAGQPADGDFRFTRVWARSSAGKWQVVAAHSCVIA